MAATRQLIELQSLDVTASTLFETFTDPKNVSRFIKGDLIVQITGLDDAHADTLIQLMSIERNQIPLGAEFNIVSHQLSPAKRQAPLISTSECKKMPSEVLAVRKYLLMG